MLLVLDVGNSNTRRGLFRGEELRAWSCLPTELLSAAEYAAGLEAFLEQARVSYGEVEGISAAFVVSPFGEVLRQVAAAWGKPLVLAGPGYSGSLALAYRDPYRLGSDRIAAAVGAVARMGKPCLVADLGTAVTVDAVSREGTFLGGAILPGIGLGLQALHGGTAALPKISWEGIPASSIGRDTEEGLGAGVYWGLAAAVEGLAGRHRRELREHAPLVVTGGWAQVLLPAFTLPVIHLPHLTLEGLREIYRYGEKS